MSAQPADDNPYGSDTVLPFQADRSAVVKIKRRFMNLNRERLARVYDAVGPHQRNFLDVLPLLFHSNHPGLPGYIDKGCPNGIRAYSPGDDGLRAASKVARSFTFVRHALKSMDIVGVYLMGSMGTIAQSARSDFDVWLCHRAGIDEEGLSTLQRKCAAISRWADGFGLEVHFFLMQPEAFRTKGAEALSSESSGSTQHHLLLDEFYRTALLLAGCAPLWWLVPPDLEHDYDGFVQTLNRHRFVKTDEYLDFGPMSNVRAEEYFGATLWQLTKAVSAPHKSLLKILLLEAYAADYPDTDLLSMRFKRAVYNGEKNIELLDPYVVLGQKVEDHLRALDDDERLELARRSFYFKVNQPLSRKHRATRPDWRRDVMAGLAETWGWDDDQLQELDERRHWKIDRTLPERRALVAALTRTYRSLSQFARKRADVAMVSQRDMTILGRKLFTAFEHKAGKVELVNQGISEDLSESHLTIQRCRSAEGQSYWLLFQGSKPAQPGSDLTAVKRGWTALELLAWSYFNGLMLQNTRVTVAAREQRLNTRETNAVNEHLRRNFPLSLAAIGDIDDFTRSPRLVAASVFINLGVDPLSSHTRKGRSLLSGRGDALDFSGWRENLVREVDYLIVTSWREVLTFKYQGMEGLLACLCEHVRWVLRSAVQGPDTIHVDTCAPRHGANVTKRISGLFEAVSEWFVAPGGAKHRRFVLRGGGQYYALQGNGDVVTHDFSGTWAELMQYLGRPNTGFTALTFDPPALEDPLLSRIYDANRPGVVQFFYWVSGRFAHVLILDETGALFQDRVPFYSQQTLVHQFGRFFEAVRLRQSAGLDARVLPPGLTYGPFDEARRMLAEDRQEGPEDLQEEPEAATEQPLRFYRVLRPKDQGIGLEEIAYQAPEGPGAYFDIKVIGETVDGDTTFTLYCQDQEFSTGEHGTHVFDRVTEFVLEHRKGQRLYPVYITDIDLSRLAAADAQDSRLHTIQYLQYKRTIERRLGEAMERIVEKLRAAAPT